VAEHDPKQPFNDDRLLAFALGLEDDPELEAALAAQPLLQRRLEALSADLERVKGELKSIVPPAGPAYERPADETWRRLQPYYAAPAAAGRAASWRWQRLLVPAAALLVVAAVSVGVVLTLHGQGSNISASSGTSESSSSAGKALGAQFGADALPPKGDYDIVVVARAGAYATGNQQFTVLRVLKGKAGPAVSLAVPSSAAVKTGDVRLLYLLPAAPMAGASGGNSTQNNFLAPSSGAATTAPRAAPAAGARTIGPAVSAQFAGQPALIVPLPAGASASTVTIP
jgi:hypothetical protein